MSIFLEDLNHQIKKIIDLVFLENKSLGLHKMSSTKDNLIETKINSNKDSNSRSPLQKISKLPIRKKKPKKPKKPKRFKKKNHNQQNGIDYSHLCTAHRNALKPKSPESKSKSRPISPQEDEKKNEKMYEELDFEEKEPEVNSGEEGEEELSPTNSSNSGRNDYEIGCDLCFEEMFNEAMKNQT